MRFKTFMEAANTEDGKWATIRKITVGTVSKHSPHVIFGKDFEKLIGKHWYFRPIFSPSAMSKEIKNVNNHIWKHTYNDYTGTKYSMYFDPTWLKFDDEEQPNLFTRDPE